MSLIKEAEWVGTHPKVENHLFKTNQHIRSNYPIKKMTDFSAKRDVNELQTLCC